MVRELLITAYLFFFRAFFSTFKLFPLKNNKITFVVSFGDNSAYVHNEIRRQDLPYRAVILSKKPSKIPFVDHPLTSFVPFGTFNLIDLVRSMYHLATSKFVIVDNYYGFLASVKFKSKVECIQLWHAAGAVKKFGLHDPSNAERSARAHNRFKKVYGNFHKLVVGSEDLAHIYFQAFGVKEENILRTGIPRTDLFYDSQKISNIKNKLSNQLKRVNGRKIIIYAPTYRESDLESFRLHLSLDQMYKELKDTHVVILRLHQAVRGHTTIPNAYHDFVYDFTDYPELNELLFICDYLITDYSSIPFEFSLLQKPMIFFPYDLDQYREERGFWQDYHSFVPGPVVYNTVELIQILQKDKFDLQQVKEFSEKWNQYSTGQSSKNLVRYMKQNVE